MKPRTAIAAIAAGGTIAVAIRPCDEAGAHGATVGSSPTGVQGA